MLKKIQDGKIKLALIGLGYVGLPLAVEFGKKFDTVGFDIKEERLDMLRRGVDATLETAREDLAAAHRLKYTSNPDDLRDRDIFIITVPTPVDKYKQPDLLPLYRASETVGKVMRPGAVVIYESTVFPGCTEEECVPVLEKFSGLTFNRDFFCGYSPERINPGDKEHTLTRILKITSGSTREAADIVDALYHSILEKGTYRASSIKVAEAAKVIENSQRDLNIAFVNELAKIFHLIGIDTHEVLEAAATKWNFLPFKPGLVGGHCIGVDPYYLTHKAQALGYLPEVILAGRRINDGMGQYIAAEVVKLMIKKEQRIAKAKVLVMGITFKENCPDIRNSHAIDVVRGLHDFGCRVTVFDPWADPEDVMREYGRESVKDAAEIPEKEYDAVVLAVAHRDFRDFDVRRCLKEKAVVFDIKGFLPRELVDGRL
ncbi:MAG TPA: Vi polysaccharide biosynthesis protein VipA/TviB [Lentisphaeria bacterium]|nr:Vi polysaccharide biosynthesis protein VipA/TviB [Lentisphaeria bacterium]HCG48370.1 Vi polysaccharide biosynthesis protein VipA/TviB [Lentisphaeria bacterium]